MTTRRQRAARAAAVSRVLRAGGLRPLPSGTPRSREGIRVSSGWDLTRVGFDLDSDRDAALLRDTAEMILVGAGYSVDATASGALLVSKAER